MRYIDVAWVEVYQDAGNKGIKESWGHTSSESSQLTTTLFEGCGQVKNVVLGLELAAPFHLKLERLLARLPACVSNTHQSCGHSSKHDCILVPAYVQEMITQRQSGKRA